MALKSILGATCACLAVVSLNTNAALIGRDLDGDLSTAEAYYDDIANLTWLADANAAAGSIFDNGLSTTDGLMTWNNATAWAASLNINGVTGWRLGVTPEFDFSCGNIDGSSAGFNCTGSEMGNLFYNVLGGSAGSSITTTHNTNYDLFSNVQSDKYWSASELGSSSAWNFNFNNGGQSADSKSNMRFAWAVQSGAVGTAVVPIPPAVWLFGSGLFGLIGVARRKA